MADDGWGLSEQSRLRIRMLEWLYDHEPSNPGQVANINDFAPDFADRPAVDRAARGLMSDGSTAPVEQRLGGKPRLRISRDGAGLVDWYRQQRANPVERERNCETAFIHWLYEQRSQGLEHPVATDFLQDWRATFWGEPFTEDDVYRATRYLRERGFIKGTAAAGFGVIRPTLTADGIRYVREGREPSASFGDTYNFNVGTNVGQLQGGSGTFQQTQHQGIDADSLSTILRAMRDALSDLDDEDDRDDLQLQIDALEAEASKQEPDPEAIERRISRLRKIAAKVGNPALVTTVTVATTELLQALGIG